MEQLHGNTQGLKPHHAKALRALYQRRVDRTQYVSPQLARSLTELSRETGRRLGLLLDRAGRVEFVLVGDAHRVHLPDLWPRRAGASRFRGVRLLLTQLRPEGLTEDDLTDLALLQLDAVATVRVLSDGLPGEIEVVDRVLQRRRQLDGRTVMGEGKLQELIIRSMHLGAECLILDRELSPSQLRNVATLTDMKVLDRTQLILDIFAQHAHSREGKLQVELAQLRYRMPRLALMPTAMSRLTGGIGGRGPGETKLEINRRRAQERVTRLERELEELGKNRQVRRGKRERSGIPVCSIVGYTNAGKSTLLNRMTQSEVIAENKLFATLDPTTRRLRFPEQREIVLADTVGFIEDLPKTLMAAFKSTLEELEEADLLLHVLDASDPDVEHHHRSVEEVLEELGLSDTPQLLVWNKADAASPEALGALLELHGGMPISALSGDGLPALLEQVERRLFQVAAQERAASDLRLLPSEPVH